jgi:N-acetylneuraminate synthase/N,N'-diacetyllegionaminate synthase
LIKKERNSRTFQFHDLTMHISIHNRMIGDGHPVFFIAEAGVNHNGSLDLAKALVDTAVAAGADAVKFQTFKTEALNTRNAPKASYHTETTGPDEEQSWFDLLKTQELSPEAHKVLVDYCGEKGILFLSTPYDEESADLLDDLKVPAFKLASTDTTNLPLLRHIAGKHKPMIISTAMCSWDDVQQAVKTIRDSGLNELIVLQCTGNYPSALQDSHLRVMQMYRENLNCLVGYSDHTVEMINPVAATAMGACVYEKHITLDKSLPGPDHRASLSPAELTQTISQIRQTEKALGLSKKVILDSEKDNKLKLQKSMVAARDLATGETLSADMVVMKRPGNGLRPAELDTYLGRRLTKNVYADTLLSSDMFESS